MFRLRIVVRSRYNFSYLVISGLSLTASMLTLTRPARARGIGEMDQIIACIVKPNTPITMRQSTIAPMRKLTRCNAAAHQHLTQAAMHRDHAAAHEQLAQDHHHEAHNVPSHGSPRAAQLSSAQARASGSHLKAAYAHNTAADKHHIAANVHGVVHKINGHSGASHLEVHHNDMAHHHNAAQGHIQSAYQYSPLAAHPPH